MTNPIDETEKLYEELQSIANQIEAELLLEQIAEQSLIELKRLEMQPIFDEYYGSDVFIDILEKGQKKPVLRDPKGGLTAAGRAYFKRKEGANLKPGVRGAANTPQKMRRKGSFLTRFFTNPSGPMKDEKGRATRLALSAAAWGEPVPQNIEDAKKLAAKGRRLLERYQNTKKKSEYVLDVFNKTSDGNYFDEIKNADLAGILYKAMPTVISGDELDDLDIRIFVMGELSAVYGKSMGYMPSDNFDKDRIKKASAMMKKRRAKKAKNG
jgi:hypothetical protein